jgi:hypothetical protein
MMKAESIFRKVVILLLYNLGDALSPKDQFYTLQSTVVRNLHTCTEYFAYTPTSELDFMSARGALEEAARNICGLFFRSTGRMAPCAVVKIVRCKGKLKWLCNVS